MAAKANGTAELNARQVAPSPLEQGVIGPPSPAITPRPATPDELRREYVSGSAGIAWWGRFARALAWSIDDITAQFGDDLYDRMLCDPQVAACEQVLRASIVEEGAMFSPAIEDKADPDYDTAVALRDEFEAEMQQMDTPLDDVLLNMAKAVGFGSKVAEGVYSYGPLQKPTSALPGGKVLRLRALKVKPRRTTSYVVDPYYNIVGLLVQETNQPSPMITGWVIDPKGPPPNLIPPEKFLIYTWRPQDSDPRGTSLLHAAYVPWWLKQQVLTEWRKYLARFASPSLIGITAQNAQTTYSEAGLPIEPEDKFLASLLSFQNGTAVAIPFGSQVQPIEVSGQGNRTFMDALGRCDQQITKAILTQSLATEEGAHQARAAAQVHQDALDTIIRQAKRGLARAIEQQIIRRWIVWNWGADLLHLAPKVTLGTTERHDQTDLINAMANLYKSGYLHESQMAAADELVGLPVRDMTDDDIQDPSGDGAVSAGPEAPTPPGAPGQVATQRTDGAVPSTPAHGPRRPAQFAADDALPPLPTEITVGPDERKQANRLWRLAAPSFAGLLLAGQPRKAQRWAWDASIQRYRDGWAKNRILAPAKLLQARDALSLYHAETDALAAQVASGDLSLSAWVIAMRETILTTYAAQWSAGKGGWRQMTDADWQALGLMVREQWTWLGGFADAISLGSLSERAIAARAALYIASSVQAFEAGHAAAFNVDLPALPGEGSVCRTSCRCWWVLDKRDDGHVLASWRNEQDRKVCTTCQQRGDDWAALLLPIKPDLFTHATPERSAA